MLGKSFLERTFAGPVSGLERPVGNYSSKTTQGLLNWSANPEWEWNHATFSRSQNWLLRSLNRTNMVLTQVKSYYNLFMGLWFVSLEVVSGSAQWTGLCVWWLEATRKCHTAKRVGSGCLAQGHREFRRSLKLTAGFLGSQNQASVTDFGEFILNFILHSFDQLRFSEVAYKTSYPGKNWAHVHFLSPPRV